MVLGKNFGSVLIVRRKTVFMVEASCEFSHFTSVFWVNAVIQFVIDERLGLLDEIKKSEKMAKIYFCLFKRSFL